MKAGAVIVLFAWKPARIMQSRVVTGIVIQSVISFLMHIPVMPEDWITYL